jgi:Domain of unknown function (DUF4388)
VSLDGNLRVFSLTEVFQMLGMQRKSGLLSVEGPKDTVTVGFVTGKVVSVESSSNPIDNRLGALLVKAGKLSENELAAALDLQKKGSERLGRLLLNENIVKTEDLREAFRLQVHRILFAAFAWTEGRFRFAPETVIDHDPDVFTPLPTESILLEAARTFDELPFAEQKIPSKELVFHRAAGADDSTAEERGKFGRREAETWKWIDGRRTVAEIRERVFLSDLDVLKGISDLLDRGLIVEGRRLEAPVKAGPAKRPTRQPLPIAAALLWIAVLGGGAFAASFVPGNRANVLFRPIGENPPLRDLLKASSLSRLLAVGRAIRVYYGSTGSYPRTLGQLVAEGILTEDALRDPYGRFYRYILRAEDRKFALYGRNGAGEIDLDLAHEGQLAPAAEVRPGAVSPGVRPDRRPDVHVVR